jgi:serine/threonine-protein kinase
MMITPGQKIGPYAVVEKIGQGGMGAVYMAEDASIRRTVVLKVLTTDVAGDAEMLQRFHREVEMIASLEHPHILPVYEFGEVDGDPYIAMRFMRGGSLHDHLHKKSISRDGLMRIFDQVAEALDFAHDRDVIHRDLKPANVLLDESGNAYLADFGLAKTMEGSRDLTKTGGILGTPAYMSPEQVRGEKLDRRSDIYSFAIMVFEAFSGQNPFKASTPMDYIRKHITESPRSITSLAADLPGAMDAVLQEALAKDREHRPARATDFMKMLRAALSEGAEAVAVVADSTAGPQARFTATAPAVQSRLGNAAAAAAPSTERRRWATPALLAALVGGGALLVILAAVGFFVFRDSLLGPKVNAYPVGDSPRALLTDGEFVWVANFFDSTLVRLTAGDCDTSPDPCGQAVATYAVPDLPIGLAHDGTSLWIASALDQTLTQLDPSSGEERGRYALPNIPTALIYAGGFLWTANEFAGSVTKVDLAGAVVEDYPVNSSPRALLWDGDSLWIASEQEQTVVQVDPRNGEVLASFAFEGTPVALAFDGQHLWVALSDRGEALKVDRSTGMILDRVLVGTRPTALLFDGTTLWAADIEGNTVIRIDVATAAEQMAISVEGGPYALAWVPCGEGCGDLWIASEAADTVSRVRLP